MWLSTNLSTSGYCWLNLFRNILSNSLVIELRLLKGLKFSIRVGSPFLKTGLTKAIFHPAGIIPVYNKYCCKASVTNRNQHLFTIFGKSKVGNEKFARVPAKEVSQILTVYSMKPNQYIYMVGIF